MGSLWFDRLSSRLIVASLITGSMVMLSVLSIVGVHAATVPSAPLNMSVQWNQEINPGNPRGLYVDWEAPSSDGGAVLTVYNLYRGLSSSGESWYDFVWAGLSSAYVDTSVVDGNTYYYFVTANNSVGEGPPSGETYSPVPPAAPTPPKNLDVQWNQDLNPGNPRALYLTWEIPESMRGSIIQYYTLYRGLSIGGESAYDAIPSGLGLSYIDSNIVDGHTYYYYVTATNGYGESEPSNEVWSPVPPVAPDAPRNLAVIWNQELNPANPKGLYLSWDEPLEDGGSTVDNYVLYRGLSPGGETYYDTVPAGLSHSYVDTSVLDGLVYYYNVTAVNSFGESDSSNEVYSPVPPSAPTPPLSLTAQWNQDLNPANPKGIYLSWNEPESRNGSAITAYNIYRGLSPGSEVYYDSVPVGLALAYLDTDITDGVTYYYYITANNSFGESAPSNEAFYPPAIPEFGALALVLVVAGLATMVSVIRKRRASE